LFRYEILVLNTAGKVSKRQIKNFRTAQETASLFVSRREKQPGFRRISSCLQNLIARLN
jgi:hypothetical protein